MALSLHPTFLRFVAWIYLSAPVAHYTPRLFFDTHLTMVVACFWFRIKAVTRFQLTIVSDGKLLS